jgi:hypothetical protein
MFEILCVEDDSDDAHAVARGFCDRAEALRTAGDWIKNRFPSSRYDNYHKCWRLIDNGRSFRVFVEQALKAA